MVVNAPHLSQLCWTYPVYRVTVSPALFQPRSEAFLMELLCGMGVCDYRQFQTLYAAAKAEHPPDPSVLDILDLANRSCCGQVEPPTETEKPRPEADGRLRAAGLQEVKAVAESRPCRGTDQMAFIPPSMDGEKKLRFEESALEAAGKQLPKTDPGRAADFEKPTSEDDRPSYPQPVTTDGSSHQRHQYQQTQ